jgi:hypothetical protein
LPRQSSSVILVDSSDIQANIPLTVDQKNDWGSEFSDSDTEAPHSSRISKAVRYPDKMPNDHTVSPGCDLINDRFSIYPHADSAGHNISQETPSIIEDNIYEEPDQEGDSKGKILVE